MPVKRNAVLTVASDTTWARALDRARNELDFQVAPATQSRSRKKIDQFDRAVYGPPPPVFDIDWVLTPHPYPDFKRGLVTPEMCEKLLDVMVKNRNPKPRKIAQYARSMIQGNWRFTNQGWAVNCEGNFQDGQQRALGAVLAGYTVDTVIYVGMPVRNFPHLDQGTNRSAKDTLDLQGETNTANMSTAIKMCMQFDQWGPSTHLKWRSFTVTNDELEDALKRYGDPIRRGASMAMGIRAYVRMSPGAFGAAYTILRRIAPEEVVEKFFADFRRGRALSDHHPVAVLRGHFEARHMRGERNYDHFVQLALVLKAWNHVVNEEEPRHIIFPVGREKFPEPREWI